MNFFNKIKNSVYSPQYYQELINQPLSHSVKYLALFALIFASLFTVKFLIFSLPELNSVLNEIGPEIINNYPSELEVTIKEGNVSTNVEEPYYIKTPDSWKNSDKSIKQENAPENLVVIDTKNEPSVENLKKYDTFALITKNYLIYQRDDGRITTQSLKEMPDVVINKTSLTEFTNKYAPYLKLIIPLVAIAVFIFSFFLVVFKLIYMFLAALLIWLIARIKKADIGYGKAYQLGMHLITLPLLVISLTGVSFPLAFTTLLLILAAVNIRKKSEIVLNEIKTESEVDK